MRKMSGHLFWGYKYPLDLQEVQQAMANGRRLHTLNNTASIEWGARVHDELPGVLFDVPERDARAYIPKYCPKCDKTKRLTDFGPNRGRADGVHGYCKVCAKIYNSERHKMKQAKKAGV